MKIIVCFILRMVFICVISGLLGVSGITSYDWQLWVILCSVIGIYACGLILGKESQPCSDSKWIDINDRLPNLNERVLVYYYCAEDYYKITVGKFIGGNLQFETDDDNQELFFVTHWRSLPDEPKERGVNK